MVDMKKFLLFAAAATMFAACSKGTTEDIAILLDNVLRVSISDDRDSRVQLDENCRTVWNEGDLVSVFNKTDGNECWQFVGKNGDKTGLLFKQNGDPGYKTEKVIALYPYDTEAIVSGNMVQTTIPNTQVYRANSFGNGGNIMVAIGDDSNLNFNSIFGWVKISLSGNDTIKSITLKGNDNEILSGKVIIDASTLQIYMGETSTIILDCGDGIQLSETPTNFYIGVIPQTFAKGFSVIATDLNQKIISRTIDRPITIARNHIVPTSEIEYRGHIPYNEIWYTSSDGKIVEPADYSYFGATIVSNTYENGIGKIIFDGNITQIGSDAFFDCRSLTSIAIPDSVTSIGFNVFLNCSSLINITIPDSVTSIGYRAFFRCSSLTSVTIGDNVTSIGYQAFENCSNITSITIPDSVTSIGYEPFKECNRLTAFYGKYASADNKCLVKNGYLIAFAPYGLTKYAIQTVLLQLDILYSTIAVT